jgi:hypothetical protein
MHDIAGTPRGRRAEVAKHRHSKCVLGFSAEVERGHRSILPMAAEVCDESFEAVIIGQS